MPVTPDYLRSAAEVISSAASLREAATLWRTRDPAMRVVVVDAMDMRDETPALRQGSRSIYLATSDGHCWSITQKPEEATALILAED
ncbi:hypothetical protein [Rhodoferax sp.]|jgi:hypothetical protein|uniref:hypothetical protein n=1 Tax=Rhodoferax sp. TaxID=50421 RepID=UPI002849A7AC|nr:hypothetical protein [Rhodoferax sp.]MDR3369495.1 hypothetical protein [Rhodoferax sp.]